MIKNYDIVIIGSGPAGFSAAMRALDFGKHVCIIEGKHLGGAGIMHGALTSKTMYELSMDYAVAARTDRGYRCGALTVSFSEVKQTVIRAAKEKQYQMLSQIETFSPERSKKGSITLEWGMASFIDTKTVEIKLDTETKTITGDHFIIATGSSPRRITSYNVCYTKLLRPQYNYT